VADQDDENRIAPAGFDVNGEEIWKWTRHPALVGQAAIAPAVKIIDAWQVMAAHGERYQDLWPR
jgi:predicted membrane-bound mannosyltransferase